MTVSIKMTASQRAKLAKLGGAEWVRKMIDRAKERNNTRSAPRAPQ